MKMLQRCINMKWIQPEPLVLQSGHGMRDGWMDGQTDGQSGTNIPAQQICCAGGIISTST